jgi:hypothetical protein
MTLAEPVMSEAAEPVMSAEPAPVISAEAMMGAEPMPDPSMVKMRLVLRQKLNNRNRRLRCEFQHKIVAIDADLDAGRAPAGSPASAALRLSTPDAAASPRASPMLPQDRRVDRSSSATH